MKLQTVREVQKDAAEGGIALHELGDASDRRTERVPRDLDDILVRRSVDTEKQQKAG